MNMEWITITGIIILLFLSGFFSAAETSLMSMDETKQRKLKGKTARKNTRFLLKNTSLLLITLLFCSTLVNTAVAALLEEHIGIENALYSTILVTAIMLFFCEILPKTLAILRVEAVAGFSSQLMFPIFVFIKPFSRIVNAFSGAALGLLSKLHHKDMGDMDKNHIAALLNIVSREGMFEKEEKDLIESVLNFAGREVWNIMTPRTKVISIEKNMAMKEIVKFFKRTKISKIPVYSGTDDNIVGVIYLRDIFQYVHNPEKSSDKKAFDIMEPMYFVPETKRLSEMLEDFRKKKHRIAAVVDEYGSCLGILTIADVLGEIVGELMDESFTLERKIIRLARNRCLVSGDISLTDFNDHFETNLQSEEYETLAGFIIQTAGDIPETGYTLTVGKYRLSIKDRSEKHIEWFLVEKES